jgi:steroid 5-alpha reductase family enzyme
MLTLILIDAAFISVAMALVWAFQRAMNNGGWTDVFWSYVLGAAGVIVALLPIDGAPPSQRQLIVAVLIAVWGVRLGSYLAMRVGGHPEDARYTGLRRKWGSRYDLMMFGFLQVQGLASLVLSLGVAAAARRPGPPDWQDTVGGALLAIAILGETLADAQLAAFKADPANKGRICDTGLWGWSRHPNYFFEWLAWLAYPVIAIDFSGRWPWGFAALAGPVLMYHLLNNVTGVRMLEHAMAKSRGAAFEAYKARTPVFFPRPPKRSHASGDLA